MIDLLIPFIFGLLVGAGGGVMIAALMAASRERPYKTGATIGRWICMSDHTVKCPECGMTFFDAYDCDHADRYCRHCGACMEEDVNE